MRPRLIVFIVLIILGIVVLANTVLVIDAGKMGVIFNTVTGNLSTVTPGTNLLIPGIQRAIIYDTRVQTYTMSATYSEGEQKGDDAIDCLTKDGQVVRMDISLRFHIDPLKVADLHRTIGQDYVSKVVRPEIRTSVRLAVSAFAVTEVYSEKRTEIQANTVESLTPKFVKNFLVLDEVLIRNVRFSPEFEKAIEAKQIAQQQAQQMQYVLEKEKLEKDRKIIEAQGEAEAIRLKAVVLASNPALIQYEYVQKIAPGVQTIITDGKTILSLGDVIKKP
ncbi:MAG TPA: prohibitin family protein [Acidobacteriota bacterium]|nr:prohibitin family protein [Acidobacteriota bacterium]